MTSIQSLVTSRVAVLPQPPSLPLSFSPLFIVKRRCCAWSSGSLPGMAFSGSWWFIITKDNHYYHHHLLKLYFWRLKTRRAVSFKIFKTKPQNTFGQEAYHPSLNQQANLASWNLLGLNYRHPQWVTVVTGKFIPSVTASSEEVISVWEKYIIWPFHFLCSESCQTCPARH